MHNWKLVLSTTTYNFFSWPSHCVIFKAPLSTSSASWLGVLNWRLAVGCCVGRCPSRTPSHSRLRLTLPVSHMDICIYHFITSTNFHSTIWLLSLIFTGASCAENFWLRAQSKVNTQQYIARCSYSCGWFSKNWYIGMTGYAHGVTVVDRSSNPKQDYLHFT